MLRGNIKCIGNRVYCSGCGRVKPKIEYHESRDKKAFWALKGLKSKTRDFCSECLM